jgi:hypothetical protein
MRDEQIAEPAQLRAAAYDRQPSVWPAPAPAAPRPERTRRLARVVRTGVTAGVLLAGPPLLLWQVSGNPITVLSSWWATGPFTADSPVPQADGLRVALIWACWLGWVVLATLLTGSAAGVLRGRRLPQWRLPMPLHRLVFGLTGTAAAALVTTPVTAAVASPAAHVVPAPDLAQSASIAPPEHATAPAPADAGTAEPGHAETGSDMATVAVGDAHYEYRVHRGDTLSKVARVWLGDPDRWPDICQLNKHRHFSGGRTLTDCDLIYPGWELRLPADAVAPPTAKPTRAPRTPARPTEPREQPQPDHSNPPVTSPAAASEAPAARPDSPAQETPSGADEADSGHQHTGNDLVLPTGSIIPWTLAAAITATAALVWLQRRRRYLPGTRDDPQDLPAPVLAAQHHTRHIPPPAPAEPADTQRLPSGGVGLIGSGADAAARGMIITALTTGTPTEPDQRAEVIIDQHTLTALFGDATITGLPRLHITDTLDQALTQIDTHLLHRARILDEHSLTTLDTLRDTAPSEEALPPLLLITDSEQAASSNRARITFGLTHDLDVTTVVVGHWPHGPTISVTDDGDARAEPGSPDSGTTRLAVLDVTTTRDLLATIREAHTGEPSPATAHTPAPPTSTAVPAVPLLPPGGVGLVGDGAHAATRAALISNLAAGSPREPDRRGEVVIDATTLATLIGPDAAALGPWLRLHVADDADQALSILDSRLVHRTRILDSLRERATHEESLPPVLLICQIPPDGARTPTRVSFALGNDLDVSALLLGAWPHGSTISVTTDGYTSVVDGLAVEAVGDRVAVLDTAETVATLNALRVAHTGEPPNSVVRPPIVAPGSPAPADEAAPMSPATSDPADDAGPSDPSLGVPPQEVGGQPRVKASLRVLGFPTAAAYCRGVQ